MAEIKVSPIDDFSQADEANYNKRNYQTQQFADGTKTTDTLHVPHITTPRDAW